MEIKTIPMNTDEIQKLFLKPGKHFAVDVKNSKLKGESFVTYLANMKIKCSLIDDSEVPSQDKYDVMYNFLTFNLFVDCDTLIDTAAILMLRSRNVPIENTSNWMTFEEMDEFIKNNVELISKISNFLDSLIISVPSFNINFKKEILDPAIESGEIELVNDPAAISLNIFGLLTIPNFLEYFLAYSSNSEKLRYYKYPVERYSYNRKTLFDIFQDLKGDSLLLSVSNLFLSEESSDQEVLNKHAQMLGV